VQSTWTLTLVWGAFVALFAETQHIVECFGWAVTKWRNFLLFDLFASAVVVQNIRALKEEMDQLFAINPTFALLAVPRQSKAMPPEV
jgi:hypothetical protein